MNWKLPVIAYLLVGIATILFTPARVEVFGALTADERVQQPRSTIVAFYSIVVTVAVLFWPLFVPSWLRKQAFAPDLVERPTGENGLGLEGIYEAMNTLASEGCDTDEIPGATGEFGWACSNPVPTHTMFGSVSYLARLRTPDGGRVEKERIGSFSSPATRMPVDGYALRDAAGKDVGVVFLSPYHQRNSERAPSGLVLSKLG